jgi:hypothetical protein
MIACVIAVISTAAFLALWFWVTLYNQALHKPWNCIPEFLMGFRQMKEGKTYSLYL